jgi:hypothetical protein
MTATFLKKEKAGVCLKLHSALYPKEIVDQFKSDHGEGLTLARRGAYWALLFPAGAEQDILSALDRLLFLARNRHQ